MARIRSIKPEFPQSQSMGRVSRDARLCFILLWTLADDSGRMRATPRALANLLFPFDDDAREAIEGWLSDLHREKAVIRYQNEGNDYLQISKWDQHQKIDKRSPARFPGPYDEGSEVWTPSPPNVRGAPPNPREPPPNSRGAPPNVRLGIEDGIEDRGSRMGREGKPSGSPAGQKAPPVPEPAPASLDDRLAETFLRERKARYRLLPRDGEYLRPVLETETEDEVVRRWGIALRRKAFPRCDSLKALAEHWNAYAADEPGARHTPKGMTDADAYDWSDGGGFNELNKPGGVP